MTPFEALYGFASPRLLLYIPSTIADVEVDKQLRSKDEVWSLLKENLYKAHNRMK